MKIFTKKSLVFVLGCMAGTAMAAGHEALPEGFPTEVYNVEPATAAQIAAETGINLEGGMLSRDLSIALFPSLDIEMIRSYAALAKYDVAKVSSAHISRVVKRWAGRVGLAGILGALAYKTWFMPATPLFSATNTVTIPLVESVEEKARLDAPAKLRDLQAIEGQIARDVNNHLEDARGRTWYERLGHNVELGFGSAVQYGVVAGLMWGVTQAFFTSDPASPLTRYFIDTLNTQSTNLASSAIEYSNIVGAAAADKTQSDENFTSIVSRGHAQFINTLENYCGYLVALRAHFAKQQEFASAQLEKMSTQKNVNELAQAEKRRALKVAQVITDNIDSTLIQAYPLANAFTAALIKAKKRAALANTVQNNLGFLCDSSSSQAGLLVLYGKQLENALYNFYGLDKPKAPDLSALLGNMGGLMGMPS